MSDPSHDVLSDLLRAARLHACFYFYYIRTEPHWAVRSPANEPMVAAMDSEGDLCIRFHMLVKGECWAVLPGEREVRMQAGDLVVFPHGDVHEMSSRPDITPRVLVPQDVVNVSRQAPLAGEAAGGDGGEEATQRMLDAAPMVMVCGFLSCESAPLAPLLGALPRLLHMPADRAGGWTGQLMRQAVYETTRRRPGSGAVLERLSEMVFVDTARRYLDTLPDDATGWLAALRDRHVGRALTLLHARPDRDWTLDALGREVGLARSALHDRFVQYLGQPPMQYLTGWRMQTGARLLADTRDAVAVVAQNVGYESEAAFSRAFKRAMGVPPGAWRRQRGR